VAGFADRAELTDETRLAGRPWARAGMSLALISHLREGRASTSKLYLFKKSAI
jgi:hypothetical protein